MTTGPDVPPSAAWLAFEGAVAHARHGIPIIAAETDLSGFLVMFSDAVDSVLHGRRPTIGEPPAWSSLPVVDVVRRRFIELVSPRFATDAISYVVARDALRILAAMGEVQSALEEFDAAVTTRDSRARVGLGPTVEVAHDIRSPLTAILFLVDMLRSGRSGAVNETQASQLAMVYSAALGLNHLACDLIDYVRGADRLAEGGVGPFSIREMLHGVSDIVQPIAEEKGLALKLSTLDDDARLGNSGALGRIMLNLATNALKFTSRGSVTLSARAVGSTRVEFSVEDTGGGIPAQALAELFQPFRLSMQGYACFSSAGLGLSICHRLVTALGGELRVTTAQGAGTRFYFEIDLVPVEAAT